MRPIQANGQCLVHTSYTVSQRVRHQIDSGIPRELFDTELMLNPIQDQYRVTPDGQRFLVLKPVTEATPTPITVVLNWTASLGK